MVIANLMLMNEFDCSNFGIDGINSAKLLKK